MENIRLKDYIKDIDPRAERRYFAHDLKMEKRDDGDGNDNENGGVISGYAAVFNKDSEDFGGWVERIAPGAFSNVLSDSDTVALFNHSINHPLGRNMVNVTLTQDDVGLFYKIQMPDTNLAYDILELVKGGIINKSSFAFTVGSETFMKGDDKAGTPNMRIINTIEKLYDVAPVTYPAYPDTSVASRSFSKFKEQTEAEKNTEEKKEEIRGAIKYMKRSGYMGMKIRQRKKAFSTDSKYNF